MNRMDGFYSLLICRPITKGLASIDPVSSSIETETTQNHYTSNLYAAKYMPYGEINFFKFQNIRRGEQWSILLGKRNKTKPNGLCNNLVISTTALISIYAVDVSVDVLNPYNHGLKKKNWPRSLGTTNQFMISYLY